MFLNEMLDSVSFFWRMYFYCFALLLMALCLVVGRANESINDGEATGENEQKRDQMRYMIFFMT